MKQTTILLCASVCISIFVSSCGKKEETERQAKDLSTAMAESDAYRISSLKLTNNFDGSFSLSGESNPEGTNSNSSGLAETYAGCREFLFNFDNPHPDDRLMYLQSDIKFTDPLGTPVIPELLDHEMYAVCTGDAAHPATPAIISGFLSVRDTKYPPPNNAVELNIPQEVGHTAFSNSFEINDLVISRDGQSEEFSVEISMQNSLGNTQAYQPHSLRLIYDDVNLVNTLVLVVEQTEGTPVVLNFAPEEFLLYNTVARDSYFGRPGGWPGPDEENPPVSNCLRPGEFWDNTQGIAIIVVDKNALSDEGTIDWSLISCKKGMLCFK